MIVINIFSFFHDTSYFLWRQFQHFYKYLIYCLQVLTIWTRPKFCSLGYFCKLDFISLYFKTPKQTTSKCMRRIGFENIIGKGGDSVNTSIFSISPNAFHPTCLNQISPFRKELTYIAS